MDPTAEVTTTSNQAGWIKKGIPADPAKAKQRVTASRRVRRKPKPKSPLTASVPSAYVAVVTEMADRHDVERSAVVKRMIEDGIRKYGSAEEIERAGLNNRMDNTFSFEPDTRPPTDRYVPPQWPTAPHNGDEEVLGQRGTLTAPSITSPALNMFGGKPLDTSVQD